MLKPASGIFVVSVLCMAFGAPEARATPETEAYIQQNFDKGYVILNNTSLTDAQRREEFRALLLELAASKRIALYTLGQYAMNAPAPAVDAFTAAFTTYSVAVYEKGLNRYEGQKLKVTGSSDRAADDSLVRAELINPTQSKAEPIKVAFRVRHSETGGPTITDILIEGVSLAATERDDFVAYLKEHGGNIAELTKRLISMAETAGAPH